ncbi:MAG: Plasmid pRiA4b ORF-3-like protein [Pelotomaculum sp. PtaU1.Bin035]|nr:MAG: Plasmid pRiA4b ORF-3-like protein [Pelotomaculum sp. PtaU1.Bin035]
MLSLIILQMAWTKILQNYIVPSPKLERFKALNSYTKYMFLFRTYWTKLDYNELYWDTLAMRGHFIYMRIGLEALKDARPGERIFADIEDFRDAYDWFNPIHRFFVTAGPIIHHLRDFGFWEYEEAHKRDKLLVRRNDPDAKAVTLTVFGLAMIRACLARPYELYNESPNVELIERCWHEDHLRPLLEKLGIERALVNTPKEPFEKAFEAIFPVAAINSAAIDAMFEVTNRRVDTGGNVYIFKVSLKRRAWRRIRISASNTLQHLHEAIQDAFEFYDDHLYAFFMDGQPWSSNAYWSRGDNQPPYADKAVIGRLGFVRGQRFLYLFDFGDEWKFDVRVEEILDSDLPPARPLVIGKKGQSPEQYPDYEDDIE